MSDNINLNNPFITNNDDPSKFQEKCKQNFYNFIDSMNPNVLCLKGNIPKCPICLGNFVEPVKPDSCMHIFCRFCLLMWLQKKSHCPLCRRNIKEITNIYYAFTCKDKNTKLDHLFYSIKHLKTDNYCKFSEKCLVCGKKSPEEELIICDSCLHFQTHFSCDPPLGLSHGKYFCRFCRRKFIESIKSGK